MPRAIICGLAAIVFGAAALIRYAATDHIPVLLIIATVAFLVAAYWYSAAAEARYLDERDDALNPDHDRTR